MVKIVGSIAMMTGILVYGLAISIIDAAETRYYRSDRFARKHAKGRP